MKKAIVAASLDPITYGHINIIERALKVFDHVTVAIGINRKKNYTFTLEERVKMAEKALEHLGDKIEVVSFQGLLVDFAYSRCIKTIIRGVRNSVVDYDFETLLNQVNQSLRRGIDTHVLFSDSKLSHVSSSVVKDLTVNYANDLLDYVPMYIKMQLEKKLLKQCRIGVTGEIGAGKSYITHQLVDLLIVRNITDVHVIDMDDIGRFLLTKSMDPIAINTRNEVEILLGEQTVNSDGFINIKKMGMTLWANSSILSMFNKIMFEPTLYEFTKRLSNKEGIILVNSALFAEGDMMRFCNNNILVVSADKDVRKKRLQQRGYSAKEIGDRIDNQYSSSKKTQIIKDSIERHQCGTIFEYNNSIQDESYLVFNFFNKSLLPFIQEFYK